MSNPAPTITQADIDLWRRELADIDAQVQTLEARRLLLSARVTKATELFELLRGETFNNMVVLSPRENRVAPSAPAPVRSTDGRDYGRVTFVEAVRGAVLNSPSGRLSLQELRATIADGELGERLAESDKGFYHAISRLTDRGEITKHKGWIYSPTALADHLVAVRHGKAEDDPAPMQGGRASPMAAEVYNYLSRVGPRQSRDVVRHLLNNAEFKASLSRNTTGAYNILSRMVARRQLSKDEQGRYAVIPGNAPDGAADRAAEPAKRNEAPIETTEASRLI